MSCLINLFDGGSGARGISTSGSGSHVGHTSGHSTGHASWHTSSAIQLSDDGIAYSFNFFLLVIEFLDLGKLVSVEPFDGFVALVIDRLPIILRDLVLDLFILNCGLHVEAVGL